MTSRRERMAARMAGFEDNVESSLQEKVIVEIPPETANKADLNNDSTLPATGIARGLFWREKITGLETKIEDLQGQLAGGLAPQQIRIDLIDDSPYQIDVVYDQDYIQSLVEAWNAGSIPEPILVRPKEDGRFEIVAGHHRTRAARLKGSSLISAYVQSMDDDAAADRVYTSNSIKTRSDWEKARYFLRQRSSNRFKNDAEVARHFAIDKGQLSKIFKLTELPKEITALLDHRPSLFNANTAADVIFPAIKQHPERIAEITECVASLNTGTPQSSLKILIQRRLASLIKNSSLNPEREFGSRKYGFRRTFPENGRVVIVPGKEVDREQFKAELDSLLTRLADKN